MFELRDSSGRRFKKYEILADDFLLYEGNRIPQGFEIGIDVRTGISIYAESPGFIATVYYNPMNQSYLVMVCLEDDSEINCINNHQDTDLVPA